MNKWRWSLSLILMIAGISLLVVALGERSTKLAALSIALLALASQMPLIRSRSKRRGDSE